MGYQKEFLQRKRMEVAVVAFKVMGIDFIVNNSSTIEIDFEGSVVLFLPYTGWHSGKSIKDGHGIKNLIKQIYDNPLKLKQ